MEWIYMIIILLILGVYLTLFFINFNKKNKKDASKKATVSPLPVREKTKEPMQKEVKKEKPKLESPIPFGFKCTWLAVKTKDRYKLAKTMSLKETYEANWSQGLETAYGDEGFVFITPVLGEWTLVVGRSLPNFRSKNIKSKLTDLMVKLSKAFGEAQYYSTYRADSLHAWVRAVNGQIIRAYAVIEGEDKPIWDKGELSKAEKALGFGGEKFPTEEDVHQISKKWSIDTFFETSTYKAANGLIGKLD